MSLSVISLFLFFLFVSFSFARYNFYSYAIEQLLSCQVRWHPRPIPALGMSQQGKRDILTLGSASVSYVGKSIVDEDLNSFLVVQLLTHHFPHCLPFWDNPKCNCFKTEISIVAALRQKPSARAAVHLVAWRALVVRCASQKNRYLGVSINGGNYPKWMVYNGKSY